MAVTRCACILALPVFTGPDSGLQSTSSGDPAPLGDLQAGFGTGAVIGSEKPGKHRVVYQEHWARPKAPQGRKNNRGEDRRRGVTERSHHFVGHLLPS